MEQRIAINFGTSGWRAIIADEFTFANVRLVSRAIAAYVKSVPGRGPRQVIVGYDTRFLSAEFARACAQTLTAERIAVLLCERDVPTPALAYQTIKRGLSGAVNFTASHNPPSYNGIKFSPASGGPAPKAVTSAIEESIRRLQIRPRQDSVRPIAALLEIFDPRPKYLARLRQLVDLSLIRKGRLRIGVDCMYGTSRGYLDTLLSGNCRALSVFHDFLNPLFGGRPPEPDLPYIPELIQLVKRENFDLGLACDGDADRFGIVDRGGHFLTPNEIVTLLFYYLLKTRGFAPKVARTFATTHMIDAIARREGVEVIETPVGFKYIGEALAQGDCLIGGEESGGLSIRGHVPEKDGILACLLIAEMVAREKKTVRAILQSLFRTYGYFYNHRINLHLTPQRKERLLKQLQGMQAKAELAGLAVQRIDFTDGFKFILADGSWVMLRPSGTEPVVRCYFESHTREKLRSLVARTRKLFQLTDISG